MQKFFRERLKKSVKILAKIWPPGSESASDSNIITILVKNPIKRQFTLFRLIKIIVKLFTFVQFYK